jgi:hypothetical protein
MRCCLARCALALAALAAAVPDALAADPRAIPHIRSAERDIIELLGEGCRRSSTFRKLVRTVEDSDLIVYVEMSSQVPSPVQAYLGWVGAGGVNRYLRIMVKVPASAETLIALLGHELQHATEVAAAPEVRDETALEALYRRIGDDSGAGHDSPAARSIGAIVRDELRWERRAVALEQSQAVVGSAAPGDLGAKLAAGDERAMLAKRLPWPSVAPFRW